MSPLLARDRAIATELWYTVYLIDELDKNAGSRPCLDKDQGDISACEKTIDYFPIVERFVVLQKSHRIRQDPHTRRDPALPRRFNVYVVRISPY